MDSMGKQDGIHHINISKPGGPAQPAWEVALPLPLQGQWGESSYLWLTDRTKRLVEFTEGYIEVLPMPTEEQRLEGNAYVEHRVATRGSRATSALLEGFVV